MPPIAKGYKRHACAFACICRVVERGRGVEGPSLIKWPFVLFEPLWRPRNGTITWASQATCATNASLFLNIFDLEPIETCYMFWCFDINLLLACSEKFSSTAMATAFCSTMCSILVFPTYYTFQSEKFGFEVQTSTTKSLHTFWEASETGVFIPREAL